MRIFSGALLVGTALIASQSTAQYLGVPYYGQPPPYTHPSDKSTYGTREAAPYGTPPRTHHHGKSSRHHVNSSKGSSDRRGAERGGSGY